MTIDWETTGYLELHGRRGSWRGPKYSRRKAGEQGLIECGMSSGGSDTIPGHVPVQGTQLKS